MQRVRVELLAVRQFNELAEVHHPHAVADVFDYREVVGDEKVCQIPISLELPHQVDNLGLDRDVQSRDRLVRDDEFWFHRQRPGHADPLSLAPGELVREAIGVLLAQAYRLEQVVHPVQPLLLAIGETVDIDALGDDVADDHTRVQGSLRVLEDHLHLAVKNLRFVTSGPVDILSVEEYLTIRGLVEPYQNPTHRSLSAPRFSHESQGLALLYAQRDPVHRLEGRPAYLEVLLQVFDLEYRLSVGTLFRHRAPPTCAGGSTLGAMGWCSQQAALCSAEKVVYSGNSVEQTLMA